MEVGQTVRINTPGESEHGKVGVIEYKHTDAYDFDYSVTGPGFDFWGFFERELEVVDV